MKEFNKIKYIPLKYQNEIRSVSNPKQSGLNLNNTNKFQGIQHLKNINFNNYNFIKNSYLNYHYNNTDINNNANNSHNMNQFINRTQNNYYTNKYKERIINDVKNNFSKDNKKKKNFYLNVNFNLNQNYTIPNINNNKINRSLSVQNYYENKNNINNINNKINLYENSYNNSIFNNNNYKKNKAANSLKSIYENENNYLNNRNNTEMNNMNKNNNKSYTKLLNNKSTEFQSQNKNYLPNANNKQNSNKNFVYHKNNNMGINNKNLKNIKILTEPINNNIQNKLENNNDQIILNLELKMKNLLKENKTDSKGRNYNIIRKIFEEAINILNFTKTEKKFLKLILLKYHEIVYAFSQENKLLKQSSENLQNMNFSLDKKYLDLEKTYKIIIKENQDMKNILSIKNNDEINFNENNIINVNQNKNNINENMMYKSIKDMEFDINDSYKKEEKYENDNDLYVNDIKLKNIENKIENINLINKDNDSNRAKSENIKKRREEFNKLNLNDLDSLYFNDKINNIHCYNSKKNYEKVPKIKFLDKCKL